MNKYALIGYPYQVTGNPFYKITQNLYSLYNHLQAFSI